MCYTIGCYMCYTIGCYMCYTIGAESRYRATIRYHEYHDHVIYIKIIGYYSPSSSHLAAPVQSFPVHMIVRQNQITKYHRLPPLSDTQAAGGGITGRERKERKEHKGTKDKG